MKEMLSLLAGILVIVGYVPYIRAIIRKETRPAKASWMIWAVLNTIILSGMYAEDTVNYQILGATIGTWVILAFALKHGAGGWTKLDKFCLGGAVLGIVLWQTFSNPVLAIITSLGVMSLGSIPTFDSAWKDPRREDKLAWTIYYASAVCAIIAIPRWTLADAAQPITFFVIDTVMMYILYIHSRQTI